LRIVLLGPPGAGKGTQAKVLSNRYSIPHISTGDILRVAVKEGSAVGNKAKGYMDKGELVPDEVVNQIVVEALLKPGAEKGFILDGYPRTRFQAEELDKSLKTLGISTDLVVYFKTSETIAVSRLSGRRVCKQCGANYHIKNIPPKVSGICDVCKSVLVQRPDDNEATVKNRLVVYERQTKELIDYYKGKGTLREVPGDLNVEELFSVLTKLFKDEGLG